MPSFSNNTMDIHYLFSLSFIHNIPDTTEVYVHVMDLNDNAPRFVLDSYQKIISENVSVDTVILRVTATDPDSTTNGRVRYSISNGNNNNTFELDEQGALRLQQRLTAQETDLFNLTILATDDGTPPKTSKPTFVYVKVKRSVVPCKEKLAFEKAVYLAEVNESTPVDTHILRVHAKTGSCSYRSKINYLFSNAIDPAVENHFSILIKTGIIKLIRPLDYDVRHRYTFYVAAVGKLNEQECVVACLTFLSVYVLLGRRWHLMTLIIVEPARKEELADYSDLSNSRN